MSANIPTWQDRLNCPLNKLGPAQCMEAEVRDLRAALAAKTEGVTIEPVPFVWCIRTGHGDRWSFTEPQGEFAHLWIALGKIVQVDPVLDAYLQASQELDAATDNYYKQDAPAMAVEPVVRAWESDDGRIISEQLMADSKRQGGTPLKAAAPYVHALGRIVPAATVAVPTDEEIANIAVHIRPDDYMAMNGSDSVDYLRYDGAVVRAFLAAAPAVQQGGDEIRNATLEEAAVLAENMIVAETWAGSTGTYHKGGKVAEKLRSMKSDATKGVKKS